jgi:hypothetical protein
VVIEDTTVLKVVVNRIAVEVVVTEGVFLRELTWDRRLETTCS